MYILVLEVEVLKNTEASPAKSLIPQVQDEEETPIGPALPPTHRSTPSLSITKRVALISQRLNGYSSLECLALEMLSFCRTPLS